MRLCVQVRPGEPTVKMMPVSEVEAIVERLRERASEHLGIANAGGTPNDIAANHGAADGFQEAVEIVGELVEGGPCGGTA